MGGVVQSTAADVFGVLNCLLMAITANEEWQMGGCLQAVSSCLIQFAQPNAYYWLYWPFPVFQCHRHCYD